MFKKDVWRPLPEISLSLVLEAISKRGLERSNLNLSEPKQSSASNFIRKFKINKE
jgi:hypothetical protein